MFTLLVWEEIPEDTKLFLIPNEVIDSTRLELLKQAHNKFINQDEENDGLRFLNAALLDEKYVNDDSMFDDGYTSHRDGGRVYRCEPTPKEWRCIFAKYKQDSSKVVEADITRVIISGFIL
jgi:hypothetical protein